MALSCLGVQAQLAGSLRAAQHQRRAQGRGLGRHTQRPFQTVRKAGHPTAAHFGHQAQRGQVVNGLENLAVAGFHDRMAAGLLVAPRRQRVHRQRVSVGYRALFFDKGADDAGFQQRE